MSIYLAMILTVWRRRWLCAHSVCSRR